MRRAAYGVLIAGAVSASLSGCSGSQSQNGVMPGTAAAAPIQRVARPVHVRVPHDLYVLSNSESVVYMLRNKTYRGLGAITNGVNGPRGAFLDRQGNLYVANAGAGNVTEYAPGTNTPSFTYSANMSAPNSVTVDTSGDVFEVDNDGFINEYFQGFNVAFASCGLSAFGHLLGVAVDSAGDVFVSINIDISGYNIHEIYEIPGGLGNCVSTMNVFGSLNVITGLAVDANSNLLIAAGNAVEVLDPPYESVSSTIGSGFSDAVDVKLNRANTLAFVTDSANQTVTVVSYPGGSNVTVLGRRNGLLSPYAAVDGPNAAY